MIWVEDMNGAKMFVWLIAGNGKPQNNYVTVNSLFRFFFCHGQSGWDKAEKQNDEIIVVLTNSSINQTLSSQKVQISLFNNTAEKVRSLLLARNTQLGILITLLVILCALSLNTRTKCHFYGWEVYVLESFFSLVSHPLVLNIKGLISWFINFTA